MRSSHQHYYGSKLIKSVFNIVNFDKSKQQEIVPFHITYDQKLKKGAIEAKTNGKQSQKQVSKGGKKLRDAFPISMLEQKHGWKVQAKYLGDQPNKDRTCFELILQDRNFFEYDYLELSAQKLEGILRNTDEHDFSDEVIKKSTFKIVNSVQDKENEIIQVEVSYNSETRTAMMETSGAITQKSILERIDFNKAFPIVMIEHINGWKLEAKIPEEAKHHDHFELYIDEKNFQDYGLSICHRRTQILSKEASASTTQLSLMAMQNWNGIKSWPLIEYRANLRKGR